MSQHKYQITVACAFNVRKKLAVEATTAAEAKEKALPLVKSGTYVSKVEPVDEKYTVHVRCHVFHERDKYGLGYSGHTWLIRGVVASNSEDAGNKALKKVLENYEVVAVEVVRTHIDTLRDDGLTGIFDALGIKH